MDNAPSGASSISMLDGSWETEARWVLKVVRTAGDWNEPLYTWYLLVEHYKKEMQHLQCCHHRSRQ
jgi:hypothetical protein